MRKVPISKEAFDNFVFPIVATSSAKNEAEFETGIRLIQKLKDPSLTIEKPLTDAEGKARDAGTKVYPYRVLREDVAVFVLEEDEWQLMAERLKERRTTIPMLAMEDFKALLDTLKDPEKMEIKA